MKSQRGTIQESDPDTNRTMNTIIETEEYCTYTQSRWFYCFSMRAPPSHLAHLPPLFSELLTDNVIRGKELRVCFSVAETEVTRVPASCLECTMNTLLDPSLPDGVSKTLYLRTEKSCKGNTIKIIFNYYLLTYLLTPWCRVLLEKLTVCSQSRNSLHFMEPEGSLRHSQASAIRPYPGPAHFSPYNHIPPPGDPS